MEICEEKLCEKIVSGSLGSNLLDNRLSDQEDKRNDFDFALLFNLKNKIYFLCLYQVKMIYRTEMSKSGVILYNGSAECALQMAAILRPSGGKHHGTLHKYNFRYYRQFCPERTIKSNSSRRRKH